MGELNYTDVDGFNGDNNEVAAWLSVHRLAVHCLLSSRLPPHSIQKSNAQIFIKNYQKSKHVNEKAAK
jgi:hypothetical protein